MIGNINKDNCLVKLGLIGVGRWGRNIVKTTSKIPGLKLICVSSNNLNTQKFTPKDCKIFPNWRDLINFPELDGVIVCTPPKTHFRISESFIKKGYPVLIEKPLTLDYDEAKKIYHLSKSNNNLVMTDFTQLFNLKFIALKESLKLVGDIKFLITKTGNYGPYRKDTPVLWDWGAHDLSVLISLMGHYPKKIFSKKVKENIRRNEDESLWNINCVFDNEIESTTLIGNMMPRSRKIGILGSKGMLVFDDISTNTLTFHSNWDYRDFPSKGGQTIKVDSKKEPLYCILESFSNLIRRGINNHWSIEMGVEISRLLTECSPQDLYDMKDLN